MAGGAPGKSFRGVLQQLSEVHDSQMAGVRKEYEQRLCELCHQNALLQRHLAVANGLIASLDPAIRLHDIATLKEQHLDSVDDGSSPQVSTSPVPGHNFAPGAAIPHTPPPAASPIAPTNPPPGAGARDVPYRGEPPPAASPMAPADPPPGASARDAPYSGERWLWEVIGGWGKGGILVRAGESTDSQQFALRLSTGAIVKEIKLNDDRLHFQLLTGEGPKEGWISTRLRGKVLARRCGWEALQQWRPLPASIGPKGEEPLPIALLFGQDRGHAFIPRNCQDIPQLMEVFNKAHPVLGVHFLKENLVKENLDNMVWMRSMAMTFVSTFANLELLKSRRPDLVSRAAGVAGIGPGIFDALCAAGVLSFEDTIRLLMAYAKLLAKSRYRTPQMMISAAGLGQGELQIMCLKACTAEGEGSCCQISAFLAEQYFFVGGTERAVQAVWGAATNHGAQVEFLTNVAVNTAMMNPMQEELDTLVEEALPNMRPPQHTIWSATAKPRRPGCDPSVIAADLKEGFACPALLQQCTDAMCMDGVNGFYHVMPLTKKGAPIQPSDTADWPYLSGAGTSEPMLVPE